MEVNRINIGLKQPVVKNVSGVVRVMHVHNGAQDCEEILSNIILLIILRLHVVLNEQVLF